MKCYCCSQQGYAECCAPFIEGKKIPTTPEQLMRSRYSAFCLENADYLVATHHPALREDNAKQALESSFSETTWRGLKVLKADHDRVEFAAFWSHSEEGPVSQLHEDSQFIYEACRWYYTTGKQLPAIKLSRNDTCFCGSGRKYKKCCSR